MVTPPVNAQPMGEDPAGRPVRAPDATYPGTPRWVKTTGILVAILLVIFVVLHLTGHSPGGTGSHGMGLVQTLPWA